MTDLTVSPFDSNRVLVGGDLLGVGLSTDGGSSWLSTFGFKSWEICSFTWHPANANTVWAATMSGPYVSTDGGVNWTEKRVGMPAIGGYYYSCPIQRILFDPGNVNHLWAFSGSKRRWGGGGDNNLPDWNSVWESTNGGNNWTRIATVGTKTVNGIVEAVVSAGPSPYNLYCLVDSQGVFKSGDGGRTWSSVNSGLPTQAVWDLVSHPTAKDTLYLSYDRYLSGSTFLPGGVARTTNGGTSWTPINTGLTQLSNVDENQASGYHCLAISRSNPNILFTSDYGFSSQGIFRSTNGGANWSSVLGNGASIPPHADSAGPGMNVLTIDPTTGNKVFGGDSATIYGSSNGGTTWFDSSGIASGSKWIGRGYSGYAPVAVTVNPYSNQIVLTALDDGKYMSSTDNGATWQHGGNGLNGFGGGDGITFAGTNGQTLYGTFGQFGYADGSGIAKSVDGGVNWTYLPAPTGATGQPGGVYALPSTPNSVWVIFNGVLYASANGGSTWSKVTSNSIQLDGGLFSIVPDPTTPTTFYLPGTTGVWKTTNGTTFTKISGSPAPAFGVTVDPNNSSKIYVVKRKTYANDGLYTYNGITWTYLGDPTGYGTPSALAVNPANSNQLVLTSYEDPYSDYSYSAGVLLSNDGGATWTAQNTGLPMLRAACVTFNKWVPGQILLGTGGRGYFKASLGQTAAAPTFSPNGGTFTSPVTVTLSDTTPAATIYYTTDGTTPTRSSASVASGGTVRISATSTLKALAAATGYNDSAVTSATFTINLAGSLAGSVTTSTATASLTTNGTVDWIHWGDASLNRKATGGSKISTYTRVGSGTVSTYNDDLRGLSWTDGSPTGSATANTNGLYISGVNNGFSFTAPADTTTRTLTVHVGGWNSSGKLVAHLSDGSAVDYVNTTTSASGSYDRNYTITYRAGSANQTITITWTQASGTGNVTINGAALK